MLYCECLLRTVVVLNCFLMCVCVCVCVCVGFVVCGCFGDRGMCTCIYCVLYCMVSFMYIYSYLY